VKNSLAVIYCLSFFSLFFLRRKFPGVTATSCSIAWCLLFPKWDSCPIWDISRMPYVFTDTRLFCHHVKSRLIIQKLPAANVPKVGHGPKMGQNEFDCASVVFLFIPLVFYCPYIQPVGHGSICLLQARFIFYFFFQQRRLMCG